MKHLMYIERKERGRLDGPGRIGWVEISKSRRAFRYRGQLLVRCMGYRYNCVDADSYEKYWVAGPRRDGTDKTHGGIVEIDEDARVEYWKSVRKNPVAVHLSSYRAGSR